MYSRKYKKIGKNTKRSKRSGSKRSGGKRSSSKRSSSKRSSGKKRVHFTRKMRGGNMMPLIGAPYNSASPHPSGNYYAYNDKVEAWPQQSNAILENRQNMTGGKKKGKKQRGGGFSTFITTLLPEDVVTLGRTIPAAAGHAYDRFTGVISSPSSMVYPTQQPLIPSVSTDTMMRPPDIVKMYNSSNNSVSKI